MDNVTLLQTIYILSILMPLPLVNVPQSGSYSIEQ